MRLVLLLNLFLFLFVVERANVFFFTCVMSWVSSCSARGENCSELKRTEQSGGEEVEEEGKEEEEEEGKEGEAERTKMAKREVQLTNHVGGRNFTK